jgi:hypothetical protein
MRGHVRKYEFKDGSKRWAVVLYQGKRVATNGKLVDSYRWIRGFQTQKTAQGELTKLLKSKGDGTYIEPSKQTLSEYLSRWLNTVESNLAPKTFERYKELVLRRALQQAVLWQLRPTNPADAVQAPRPPDIEMKPIEEERAGELILSSRRHRDVPAHLDGALYRNASGRDSCHPLERS